MSTPGKTDRTQAPGLPRKSSPLPILLVTGLLSTATFVYGVSHSLTASRQRTEAACISQFSRDSLWLHETAGSKPRKEWQPVQAALETAWPRLASDPTVKKPLDGLWHTFDKSLTTQGRVGAVTAGKLSEAAQDQADLIAQQAETRAALAARLMPAGAAGLLLSLLLCLGLARRQRLTQFQTTQTYLAAERTAWDKQRSIYDAQRDQLIAELQQAQQHKVELDHLRQSGSRQFEEFFRTLPVACFCVASSGKIVRWNAACEAIYGRSAADVLDKPIWETVIPPEERERVEAQLQLVLAGEALSDIDRRDRHADGSVRDVRCSLAPLRDATGQIIGCLSANLAVTDLKAYEQQIEAQSEQLQEMQSQLDVRQAEIEGLKALPAQVQAESPQTTSPQAAPSIDSPHDSVTGLLTHSKFQGLVHTEFERSARYHTPLSLVLIDLDQFDAYNQAVGYQAGDQALRNIADMLGTKVRTVDTIARFGPDEFAILLPETNRAGAQIAAERFQSGIAGLPWMRRLLTASLSVTLLTPDLADSHAFIERARQLLWDTKAAGTGRIVISDETAVAAPVATGGSRRKRA